MSEPSLEVLAKALQTAVGDLQRVLSTHKVALQGTYEAAIAEAQGAQIFMQKEAGKVADHLASLRQGVTALRAPLNTVQSLLGKVNAVDSGSYVRLRESLAKLMDLARDRLSLAEETIELSEELQKTAPRALQGAPLGAGERVAGSMISNQIGAFSDAARAQWRSLVPVAQAARPAVQQLLSRIRQLPVSFDKAAAMTSAAAATARASISAALRLATTPRALRIIGTALEALWTLGGRLISVPLLIVPVDENGNPLGTSGTGSRQEL